MASDDLDDATVLVNEVATAMVHDPAYRAIDWASLALVVRIDDGASMVSMHGYAYLDDGEIVAETPEGDDVADKFRELRAAMAKVGPTGRAWKAALVQITRATGAVGFQFEMDDAERWNVTPANWETMREDLRPAG